MDLVSLFMLLSWKSQPIINILLSTFLQDYTSNHYVLSLPMKQVLVHEVRHCRLKCFLFMIYILLLHYLRMAFIHFSFVFPYSLLVKLIIWQKCLSTNDCAYYYIILTALLVKCFCMILPKRKVFAWRLSGVQIWMNKNEMWMSNTTIWLHKAWVYL
jgi:hypothetical protein